MWQSCALSRWRSGSTTARSRQLQPATLRPPRDALPAWYLSKALASLRKHQVLYLTPFAHRLAEELGTGEQAYEWQRLRCRANFHALRFLPPVEKLAATLVRRLHEEQGGPFVAVHLRFEMDMLAFAGCFDIFSPEEQAVLREYRSANFAEKQLKPEERRRMGKCPLTPEEVGRTLRALGFPNTTRLYLAAGELFGGQRFMAPLRALFPFLVSRTTLATAEELAPVTGEGRGLLGSAVDYAVCLQADVFLPTYDGPSNFANNVMGHRLYSGFRPSLQLNRKALAHLFLKKKEGRLREAEFNRQVRIAVARATRHAGSPHARQTEESFFTHPWPECFSRSEPAGNRSEGKDSFRAYRQRTESQLN
eukprot:TRINITY_DN2924_c0_g1_i2.p1 TRINITY_DN2924_c0_g1~~TRINITY_DN2924_c0_g1_i2.p1  ORF type:complete len:364 (+),score=84.40 TRINITY_DN2924_c0_g1_i2:582-1673(+)